MDSSKITLRSVYGKVEQTYTIQPCIDPETGEMPKCVRPVNKDGDMILSQDDLNSKKVFIPEDSFIEVKDGTTFDLEKPLQRAQWEAIEHSDLIVKDRNARDAKGNYIIDGNKDVFDSSRNYIARYGVAVLYVERLGESSERKVARKKLVFTALEFINKDSLQGLLTKCKLLGREMKYAQASEVEEYLIDLAEKEPQKIIDLYTGSDTEIQMLFIDAEDKNVIIKRGGLYMYGDNINLGATRDSVLFYLKQPANKRVRDMIAKETYPDYYTEAAEPAVTEEVKTNGKKK